MELISGKMTSKGQITIPKELRDKLNVSEGDQFRFMISDDATNIRIEPIKRKKLSDVIGRVNTTDTIDLKKMREVVQEEAAKEIYAKEMKDHHDD